MHSIAIANLLHTNLTWLYIIKFSILTASQNKLKTSAGILPDNMYGCSTITIFPLDYKLCRALHKVIVTHITTRNIEYIQYFSN